MQDTPQNIINLQRDIFNKMSVEERFAVGVELIENGWFIVECDIKAHNPNISYPDLRAEMFKRIYASEFDKTELEIRAEHIKQYWLNTSNKP